MTDEPSEGEEGAEQAGDGAAARRRAPQLTIKLFQDTLRLHLDLELRCSTLDLRSTARSSST